MSNAVATQVEVLSPGAPAPAEVPAVSHSASLLRIVDRAMGDPTIDIARLDKLMQLYERSLQLQAERAFNRAMGEAQALLPSVVRDADNSHTKSKYARLETIIEAINPIITRAGFSLSFGTEDCPTLGSYRVVGFVAHSEGHMRRYQMDLPADISGSQGKVNKTPIQALGSTTTYGRRLITTLVFNVAMKGEDDDGNTAGAPVTISDEQIATLTRLIEETGSDIARFCNRLKVESLALLPAEDFEEAFRLLREKAARKAKEAAQ